MIPELYTPGYSSGLDELDRITRDETWRLGRADVITPYLIIGWHRTGKEHFPLGMHPSLKPRPVLRWPA